MTVGGAFLGGADSASVPAGYCRFIYQVMTEDRSAPSVTVTASDGGGHTYSTQLGSDGYGMVLVVATSQAYTVSISTTGYDGTSPQSIVASSAVAKYVRFELIRQKVNLTGDQTVSGHKTFVNDIQFGSGSGGMQVHSPDGTKTATMNVKCSNDNTGYAESPYRPFDKTHQNDIVTNAVLQSVLEMMHPVGSIYTNASDSRNPAIIFGFGTWSAFGAGRVMIGHDSDDADFTPVGKTGGEKTHILIDDEMPSHTHSMSDSGRHTHACDSVGDHGHDVYSSGAQEGDCGGAGNRGCMRGLGGPHNSTQYSGSYYERDQNSHVLINPNGGHSHTIKEDNSEHSHAISNTGGDIGHNNIQPYIVVYAWVRTA